jgi:acetylornithine deacetylase/succinyl-diaminopimelate desuccinylase-like protein
MMAGLMDALAAVDAGLEASIGRLADFMRIESISTDPAYKAECRKAGQWLADELGALGFDSSLRDTPGHPMVVAHHAPKGAAARTPHVLFYGHYDVQPVVPLEKWVTPPFEATRKMVRGEEQIFGRGAADDKGQLLTFVEAARAWIAATGSLPVNITVLSEGEEESGSPSLVPFLKANAKELSRDIALVCDTNMWDAKTPAITTRLRGLAHEEVTITGPSIDLHSGSYGGPARNPIRVLSKILSEMHDARGRITIPGFYEGVAPLPKAVKKQWEGLKFPARKFLGEVGLALPAGEEKFSALEQIWSRPTAEVNGIYGGYQGAGVKTVLPSQATAKLTFRLVGKQNPAKIVKAFRAFVKARLPRDCKVAFAANAGGSPACEIAEDNPFIARVAGALRDEFRRDAVLMGCGGSIPVVRHFKDVLGMDSVLAGFGLPDDAIHSPNEKYSVSSFHKGIRSWTRIIAALA